MKTLLRSVTLATLLLFGCKETIIEERIPKEYTNDLLHADLLGKVLPVSSHAKVFVSQVTVVDSQEINSADGSFAFRDLRSGNYDVTIRTNNYRTFKRINLQLNGGNIVYLGEITLSTVPDEVDSNYPVDKDEIVYDWRYGTIAISVLFNQSMDRESVEKAFSTNPPSEGMLYMGILHYSTVRRIILCLKCIKRSFRIRSRSDDHHLQQGKIDDVYDFKERFVCRFNIYSYYRNRCKRYIRQDFKISSEVFI